LLLQKHLEKVTAIKSCHQNNCDNLKNDIHGSDYSTKEEACADLAFVCSTKFAKGAGGN